MLWGKEKLLLEVKAKGQPVRELLRQHVSAVDSVTRANTTKGGNLLRHLFVGRRRLLS